jgi:hydrogenase-4 component B
MVKGITCASVFAAAVLVLIAGIAGLSGWSFEVLLPHILPLGGGLALGLDRLSAFFLVIIAAGVLPSALYAVGYTQNEKTHSAGLEAVLSVFIFAMAGVVLARNVLTFLIFWEAMSLASYFLVMTENDLSETRRAGWLYAVMTHAGLACILLGFLTMAQSAGSLSLLDWARTAAAIDPSTRDIAFVLMAAGFLSKAGATPFHIWLPRAHPAAPSHISAVMSGVMIKLGVYGIIRMGFEWLGVGPRWWGVLILLTGAISAVLGVLYAIIDSDIKRLLAYSSVENIGVILLGVGAGLIFHSYDLNSLAALALVAALLHCINHTIFKSLLFLGAGSIVHATGTRNIEEMGGLLRRMPQTGALFLIGSLAISAMPPFNGFVSEWLTFQSLLLSFRVPQQFVNLVFAGAIAALALTAGLAAACFVRAFGITFLALPRGECVERAHDPRWTMQLPTALLAAAAAVLGIAPVIALRPLAYVTGQLVGEQPDLAFGFNNVVAGGSFATIAPGWVALTLAAVMFAAWLGFRISGASLRLRYYETWGCGRALQSASFEYTGAAFANPFKRVFAFLYRPVTATEIEGGAESRLFVKTIKYRHASRSIIEEGVYAPLAAAIRRTSARVRAVQSGNVHSYLLYMLLALVVLLLVAK